MFRGYLSAFLSLTIQLVAALMLFDLAASPITLFGFTSITATLCFGFFCIKQYKKMFCLIKENFPKIVLLNIFVFIMVLPIYFCLINSMYPAVYALNFGAMLGFLALLEKKNAWCFAFVMILLIVISHYKWDPIVIVSLLGPLGAYGTIKVATEMGRKHELSTSETMFLRYVISALIFLLILPWLPPLRIPGSQESILYILLIIFSHSILSVFFSQKAALHIGHENASFCYTFRPLFYFLAQGFFLHIENDYLTTFSAALVLFSLLAIRLPIPLHHFKPKTRPSEKKRLK